MAFATEDLIPWPHSAYAHVVQKGAAGVKYAVDVREKKAAGALTARRWLSFQQKALKPGPPCGNRAYSSQRLEMTGTARVATNVAAGISKVSAIRVSLNTSAVELQDKRLRGDTTMRSGLNTNS